MTEKDRTIQVIRMLPDDATLRDILDTLEHLGETPGPAVSTRTDERLPEGGLWDLMEQCAGTVDMPSDRSREHHENPGGALPLDDVLNRIEHSLE